MNPYWLISLQCNDAPTYSGLYFQEPATGLAENLILFHDQLLFIMVVISVAILWALVDILLYNSTIPLNHLIHGSTLEIIWTLIPALILVLIALPSFRLLYLLDEILDPSITVKATGFQWFWNYELSDFPGPSLNFDSYCVLDGELENGQLSLLEVDTSLILPTLTHISILTTAQDVMHCFAIPSLGVSTDAIPGRLNAFSFILNSEGIFRGICAELCGAAHGQMPIVVEAIPIEAFSNWILQSTGD